MTQPDCAPLGLGCNQLSLRHPFSLLGWAGNQSFILIRSSEEGTASIEFDMPINLASSDNIPKNLRRYQREGLHRPNGNSCRTGHRPHPLQLYPFVDNFVWRFPSEESANGNASVVTASSSAMVLSCRLASNSVNRPPGCPVDSPWHFALCLPDVRPPLNSM